MQVIALEDIAEFAVLAFADPARVAGRTLELAGDDPTPAAAATGIPVRYAELTDWLTESGAKAIREHLGAG